MHDYFLLQKIYTTPLFEILSRSIYTNFLEIFKVKIQTKQRSDQKGTKPPDQ